MGTLGFKGIESVEVPFRISYVVELNILFLASDITKWSENKKINEFEI